MAASSRAALLKFRPRFSCCVLSLLMILRIPAHFFTVLMYAGPESRDGRRRITLGITTAPDGLYWNSAH